MAAKNVDGAVRQALLSALRPTALQAALEAYEKGRTKAIGNLGPSKWPCSRRATGHNGHEGNTMPWSRKIDWSPESWRNDGRRP